MSRRDQKSKKELDYDALNVSPPTVDEHGTEEEIRQILSQKQMHQWRQKGNRLFCTACPYEHGTEAIPTNVLLMGTDSKGMPILKTIPT